MVSTLDQLHVAAEWILAGPQYAASGTLRLRVTQAGIATVTMPDVELTATGLRRDKRRAPYSGTVGDLARAVGIVCVRPQVTYRDPVPGGPDTVLDPEPGQLAEILGVYHLGQAALVRFAPTGRITLWPEHFDLATRTGGVNFGISPGDTHSPDPYAYVGPDTHDADPFWNAPFGASLPVTSATPVDDVVEFFERGQERAP